MSTACCSAATRMLSFRSCNPTWCMTQTRSGGYQTCSSFRHWLISVAGQTMSTPPVLMGEAAPLEVFWMRMLWRTPEWCSVPKYAAIWTVFPRPISSARMPPIRSRCKSQSQRTQVCWYGYSASQSQRGLLSPSPTCTSSWMPAAMGRFLSTSSSATSGRSGFTSFFTGRPSSPTCCFGRNALLVAAAPAPLASRDFSQRRCLLR
mmetsp:Transcript_132134/g.422755  ORF Transcript_132134/g.422755 Transcript_132134/m.422755 type:complete len:205 (+) Transcript_132134:2352-2966(+)